MHREAYSFIADNRPFGVMDVLDIGGRNVNGSLRGLFPHANWTVLDKVASPEVDIIADASCWTPTRRWDLVLCTEVLEHVENWQELIRNISIAARKDLLITCAGPGRLPHSGFDGGPLAEGEYYSNIDPAELFTILKESWWPTVIVWLHKEDIYAHCKAGV